jgi:hypothetical protein
MDDDLRQKFAPRRNKRYAHLRGFNEEAEWGRGLDWKSSDYEFYRLTRSVLDGLDSQFREEWGIRVDQLANIEQMQNHIQILRAWYLEDEEVFGRRGIYCFLHITLRLWLAGKAWEVQERRREVVLKVVSDRDWCGQPGCTLGSQIADPGIG